MRLSTVTETLNFVWVILANVLRQEDIRDISNRMEESFIAKK